MRRSVARWNAAFMRQQECQKKIVLRPSPSWERRLLVCLIGELDYRNRWPKLTKTITSLPYAKPDFAASTQNLGRLSRVHVDRVARGDRDYCNTRRTVASGFEQGKGIGQERQLHEQPSSNRPGFRQLLSGPEWPSS